MLAHLKLCNASLEVLWNFPACCSWVFHLKPHILESISNLQENCKCHCGVNSISKRMLSGVADTHIAMDLTAMQFHNVKEYNCRKGLHVCVCVGGTLSCQHFIRILTSSLFGTVIEIKLDAICISHLISTICHSFSFGTSGPFETNMTDIQIWFAVFSEGFTLLMFVCKWQPCILKVFAYVVHVRGCRVHWQRWSMCSHWKSTEYEQVFLMKRRQ